MSVNEWFQFVKDKAGNFLSSKDKEQILKAYDSAQALVVSRDFGVICMGVKEQLYSQWLSIKPNDVESLIRLQHLLNAFELLEQGILTALHDGETLKSAIDNYVKHGETK